MEYTDFALDWPLRWQKSDAALLRGDARAPVYNLALFWQLELALQGFTIFTIDATLSYNVHLLAAECLQRGLPVEDVLESLLVQRAFTPYQVIQAIDECIPGECIPGERSAAPASRIVFFHGPCKEFLDGEVSDDAAAHLLKILAGRLQRLVGRGVPLVIADGGPAHALRTGFYRSLLPFTPLDILVRGTGDGNLNIEEYNHGADSRFLFPPDGPAGGTSRQVSPGPPARGPAAFRRDFEPRPSGAHGGRVRRRAESHRSARRRRSA